MAGASGDAKALVISEDEWETVSESSEQEAPGEEDSGEKVAGEEVPGEKVPGEEVPGEEPCMVHPRCVNCEVYNWRQKKDLASLIPCSGCSRVSYCSEDCRKEHWLKVHRYHCAALAGPGGPGTGGEAQQEGRCRDCGGVHQEGECPACREDDPTYPNLEKYMMQRMMSLAPHLSSHHPFPLSGLPGDRTERIIIILQKLLLKMAYTQHKVTRKCSEEVEELLWIMMVNRSAIWFDRKTKPMPTTNQWVVAAINPGQEEVDKIKHKTGRLHQEYILSDDHFRLYDLFMIVHTILEYTTGPLGKQHDFKDPLAMVPDSMRLLVEQSQNSTYLEVVDKVLEALEPQVVPYIDIVKIICGGSLEKLCSVCRRPVTVAEVSQIKKRVGRVATWFNTLNMGLVRCERMSCLHQFNQVGGML